MLMGIIRKTWIIGGDLGDLVYFYGEGKDGFGLYRGDAGGLGFEYAEKIELRIHLRIFL